MNLEDLPWEDVIISKILILLNIADLLNLRKVSPKFRELVDSYLKTLKSLDLSSCSDFEPSFFPNLMKICGSLETANFTGNCWLEDSHIENLFRNHPALRNLNLSDCSSEKMQFTFFAVPECKNLISVKLQDCTIIDDTISDLVKNCPTLETLDLRNCLKVTDTGILTLRFSPRLKFLFVDNCKITERSLAPLRNKIKIDVPQKQICVARPLNLQV